MEDDRDLKPSRSHVIGFWAFGELLVWNQDHRIVDIDTLRHRVTCRKLFKQGFVVDENGTVGIAVGNVDSKANDPSDENGKPLFKRVFKACGPLEFGQIYTLKLHPALGGPIVIENFSRRMPWRL